MCDALTIIAGASLALSAGSQVAAAGAQNKASRQNREAAIRARNEDFRALGLQEVQIQDAAQESIMATHRQAQQAEALARVSAGEAGVSGASVEAIIGDIAAQAGRATVNTERNLDASIRQIQQEKRGTAAGAQSRINAVQPANPFAVGLGIGAQALDFAANQIKIRTPDKAA